MILALQCGHGMKAHCLHLIEKWGGGCAILSPRDLNGEQLKKLAGDISKLRNGKILLDPQFYLPVADHQRLTSHTYWPSDYASGTFWTGGKLEAMLQSLAGFNLGLGSMAVILPGVFADRITADWLSRQKTIAETARRLFPDGTLYSTVALGSDALRSDDQIHDLLEDLDEWPINGVYLVAKHPEEQYLIEDPLWIANLLDLCAGIRLRGLSCFVGYTSHQLLPLALTKADALASGTYLNVRSFSIEKFDQPDDDEDIKRKSVWYYSPDCLSEYKKESLDLAQKAGLLHELSPKAEFGSDYAAPLFSGAQPTSVDFGEQNAHRHYLHCLHSQTQKINLSSYDSAKGDIISLLEFAQTKCDNLRKRGIRGQNRDFSKVAEATISAIYTFDSIRGDQLRAEWNNL